MRVVMVFVVLCATASALFSAAGSAAFAANTPKLAVPSDRSTCPSGTTTHVINISGIASTQQLKGTVWVEFVVPPKDDPNRRLADRLPVPGNAYPIQVSADGSVTSTYDIPIMYPAIDQWPPGSTSGLSTLHVDIAILVIENGNVTATLGPGQDWSVSCAISAAGATSTPSPAATTAPAATSTPVIVPTSTLAPTATRTPAPTATTVPTAQPTATSQAAGMIDGIPICASHDPTKWHGLVERNPDGSVACTYTHEHKDNPHALDGVLGPLPLPADISYPWMTTSSLGTENDAKHRVYAWQTVQVDKCTPSFETLGFDAIRLEAHQDGNSGATTRYHSYWVQGRTCDPNDPSYHGTISIGGHLDFGYLYIDCIDVPLQRVPVPADSSGPYIDGISPNRRLHGGVGCGTQQRYDVTWYGKATGVGPNSGPGPLPVYVTVGMHSEDWGPIDPNNPGRLVLYGGTENGSWQEPVHLLDIYVGYWLDDLDGVHDGYVTYDGYTDRYANIVQGCSAATVGPDCVPVHFDHVKIGAYQFRADVNGVQPREYDVTGLTGQSLITFPN